MKKYRNNLLAAALCVAGLSTCMLSMAKADSIAFSPANLSLIQSESTANFSFPSFNTGSPVVSPVNELPSPALNVKTYQFNNSLNLPSTPSYSLPVSIITPNSVIPEPSSTACLLLGLGVLVGFRYLKVGRQA